MPDIKQGYASQQKVDQCRASGDRAGLASALISLSAFPQNANRLDDAVEAVTIERELGDQARLLRALEGLALRYATAARYDQAVNTTEARVVSPPDQRRPSGAGLRQLNQSCPRPLADESVRTTTSASQDATRA